MNIVKLSDLLQTGVNEVRNPETYGIVVGNRIPKDYFITKGTGESDITVHAGSYHLALKKAGVEVCNIMTYSSILPGIAHEVERPKSHTHGAVMESIFAVANGNQGELLTAGIIYGWLYDKQTNQRYGGLVCEHNGNYSVEKITGMLNSSLQELYTNGFDDQYHLKDITVLTESFVPKKKYGTALVAICFTSYVYPFI